MVCGWGGEGGYIVLSEACVEAQPWFPQISNIGTILQWQ